MNSLGRVKRSSPNREQLGSSEDLLAIETPFPAQLSCLRPWAPTWGLVITSPFPVWTPNVSQYPTPRHRKKVLPRPPWVLSLFSLSRVKELGLP